MLIEPIFLALLIGFAVKGTVKNLTAMQWRFLYLPIVSIFIETLATFGQERFLFSHWSVIAIQVVVYGLLVAFFLLNRHLKGLEIIGVGILLNAIVVFANKGYMPVSATMAEAFGYVETLTRLKDGAIFGHALMGQTTILNSLGDWIHIPPPYWFPKSVSPGDLVMDLGFMVTIVKGMKGGQ